MIDPRAVELIERVVYDEARGEGVEGRNAVRAVIYNRMAANRPDFGGSSPKGVLNAKGQFQGVWEKGRGNAANLPFPKDVRDSYISEHLEFIQSGYDPTKGATFFLNKKTAARPFNKNQKGTRIGNHEFFDNYNGNKVSVPDFAITVKGFNEALTGIADASKKGSSGGSTTTKQASMPIGQGDSGIQPYTGKVVDFFKDLFSTSETPTSVQTSSLPSVQNASQDASGVGMFKPYTGQLVQGYSDGGIAGYFGELPEGYKTAAGLIADFTPIVGEAKSAYEGYEAYQKGDYGDAALGAVGALPIVGGMVRGARKAGKAVDAVSDVFSPLAKSGEEAVSVAKGADDSVDAFNILGLTDESVEAWRKQNKVGQRQTRTPEVQDAAKQLSEGKISSQQYRDTVKKFQPIKLIEDVPPLPSLTEIASALNKDKVVKGIVGVNKNIPDGTKVASRLDIPAYDTYNTWVVSLHDGTKSGGEAIGYGQTAVLKNVEFKSSAKGAINIATGRTDKSTIARIYGDWKNQDPEKVHEFTKSIMKNPEWTQVGMNPFRHSYFYDKIDGMPVVAADEVVQVGPLVMAKGVKKASPDDAQFKISKDEDSPTFFSGGVMDVEDDYESEDYMSCGMMMPEMFDFAVGTDPVSGNPIPPGSNAENVRDDIPAVLSTGEYVVPADVVRYHGLKTFMSLRDEAKLGLMSMHYEGQIQTISDEDLEEPQEEEPVSEDTEEPVVSDEKDSAEEGDEELPEGEYETPEGNMVEVPEVEIEIEGMEVEDESAPEYAKEDFLGDEELIKLFMSDPKAFKRI